MRQLDFYIAKTVFAGLLLVLLVLIGLFTFFSFIEEIDDIGTGQYGAIQAMQYVLLQVPRRVYELFPVAALLGSLLGLGMLANTSELTAMRAAGVSIGRIIWAVMKLGLVLLAGAILLGEQVAPYSEQYAARLRSTAKSEQIALQTPYGFWARDGQTFVNVRTVEAGGRLGDVWLYDFDAQHRLQKATHARHASYQAGKWVLEELSETELRDHQATTRRLERVVWDSLLSPGLVGILILKPDKLSALELYRYISYLKDNGQRALQYELAFWQKLLYPLTSAIMVLLAVPFVFAGNRSVSISQRLLVGALLGIGFHLLNQTVGHMGVLYDFNPLISAALPGALFFALAWGLTRWRVG